MVCVCICSDQKHLQLRMRWCDVVLYCVVCGNDASTQWGLLASLPVTRPELYMDIRLLWLVTECTKYSHKDIYWLTPVCSEDWMDYFDLRAAACFMHTINWNRGNSVAASTLFLPHSLNVASITWMASVRNCNANNEMGRLCSRFIIRQGSQIHRRKKKCF